MSDFERLDDADDPRLRPYLRLTDPALRRGYEAGEGLFIAEGSLVVQRLIQSRFPVRSVLVTERASSRVRDLLAGTPAPVLVVSEDLARSVTGFHLHRGILACGARLALPDPSDLAAGSGCLLVLEDIADQTNMGALFRNAAALGADGVLLSPGCCDPLYRRSIRVSMGASLLLPFSYLPDWPEALSGLARSHALLALTPAADAEPIDDLDADAASPPVALLLGTEGEGLTAPALALATGRVRIPMSAMVDSLNVATAAAVALARLGRPGSSGSGDRGSSVR
jgi:tRNA G18 (ribose-2'-O)-methylase SpoU